MPERSKWTDKIFFTPVGAALLVIASVILVRALIARNAYEIVLGCAALLLLLVLGVVGTWKSRKLAELEIGWKHPYPMTAGASEESVASGFAAGIPLFFRYHFVVRGKFKFYHEPHEQKKKRGACWVKVETSVPRGETSTRFKMDFPVSGVFTGEGVCRLRDVFGFFSFACGHVLRRTVNVRSSPCFGKDYHINAQSGAEDRRNKQSTDEERYYMREYTPGDRLRDINWKSSEKIDTLITRISPDNQEKVSRIQVYFRNFCASLKPSLEELWLLDRAKARLSHFLRSLREQQSCATSAFIFDVTAGGASGVALNWEITDEESLDSFLEELAALPFVPPQNENAVLMDAAKAEIYVFSTACDLGLNAFLLASSQRAVSLFLVQPDYKGQVIMTTCFQVVRQARDNGQVNASRFPLPASPDPRPQTQDPNKAEILYKHDFLTKGLIPLPRWLLSGKIKPMGVQAAKTEIIYAETRL